MKICKESKKLCTEVKGLNEKEFKDLICFVIKIPLSLKNKLNELNENNIFATKNWIDDQMSWFHKNCKKGRKPQNKINNNKTAKKTKKKNDKINNTKKINKKRKIIDKRIKNNDTNYVDSEDTVSTEENIKSELSQNSQNSQIQIKQIINGKNGYYHNNEDKIKKLNINNDKKRTLNDMNDINIFKEEQIFSPPIKRRKVHKTMATKQNN